VTGNTAVERNYHAFFFMLRGHEDMDLLKKIGMTRPDGSRKENTDFKFIAVANEGDMDWVAADIKEWKDVMKAYNDLGFSKAE
jgi:myosin heavy subunit